MPNKSDRAKGRPYVAVKLERFIRPFLRMVTDDRATVVFKQGDQELQLQTIDYNIADNQWTVNFAPNQNPGE